MVEYLASTEAMSSKSVLPKKKKVYRNSKLSLQLSISLKLEISKLKKKNLKIKIACT
jgi:hypothetical protein